MSKRLSNLVNGITIYRIAAAPVLVLLALNGQFEWFKWLLAISFFTDAIDGILARTLKVVSVTGARLDSIGDDLTVLAGILGVVVFKSEFLKEQLFSVVLLLSLFAIQTIFALLKYGKMTSFHTYGAKVAAVFQAIFLLSLFFLPNEPYVLFYLTVILTALELTEEIIIVYRQPVWEADVKGLYWIIKKKGLRLVPASSAPEKKILSKL